MDSDSSIEWLDSDDGGISLTQATQRGRKNIRTVKEVEELSTSTRVANIEEDERIKRIENLNEKFKIAVRDAGFDDLQLILEYNFEDNLPLISVHETLASKLKSHQKEGVKFMWNACYESLEQIKKSAGSGCILAHCMGLGKTLQVVTLVHTLLNHKEIGTHTVLICCPKNTLLNWINEFTMWISSDMGSISISNPTRYENYESRLEELTMWQVCGGVCIINYELFRILLEEEKTKGKKVSSQLKKKLREHLLDPGPDLVICDEGHILKNEGTRLFKIMNQIRTARRIILTGTPLQNNLKEYHCMVQFVKPNLLGTRNEFLNMFVNPILNGQYENSLVEDVQLMKERSHVLHKKLLGCVQRFDLSVLRKFLPEKNEYVIFVPLTDCQIDMYRFFMKNYSARGDPKWKNHASALFSDYQALQRIWTHPYTFRLYEDSHLELMRQERKNGSAKRKKKKSVEEEEDETDLSETDSHQWRRYPLSWWTRFASIDDIEDCRQGNKLTLILKILKECEDAGEKLLLFSGSLYSLKLIVHFLSKINRSECENPSLCDMTSTWEEGEDYLILTGQTSAKDRDSFCKRFNNINDSRLRLFLISTKAGGMGINLTAANRAVLFDVSWNPSHDVQSIFRIYRIGQMKPCFVYRLVASGTMEEKIYERQVAKQSISHRVVDELQTARHFTETELSQLYKFEPYRNHKSDLSEIKDPILLSVSNDSSRVINGIHEHDSLLEHKEEEELKEAEKNNAWNAFNYDHDKEYETLPDEVKLMLKKLTPDTFDPSNLRIVLEKKFPQLLITEINELIDELMPKIQIILERPDFIELMTKQALLYHKSQPGTRVKLKTSRSLKSDEVIIVEDREEKEESVICLSAVPKTKTKNFSLFNYSDSDDSVFLYECRKSKKKKNSKKKPLRSWGARNGKVYGSPDNSN